MDSTELDEELAELDAATEGLTQGLGKGTNRVVVDWDGTCVTAAWPEMGDWLPGARPALHKLLEWGYEVVIFSARFAPVSVHEDEANPLLDGDVVRIRAMLDEAGLQEVDLWFKPWKPGAVAYLDDKGVVINPERSLLSWAEALVTLERKP